jgi:Holliday junction resolvasome RuvABC ATP-dependent DNA helicase subunit
VPLDDYGEDEVTEIAGLRYPNWPDAIRRKVARYGRFVPRIALEIGKELSNEALVSEHPERSLEEHLSEVVSTRRITEEGLGPADIEYLELLDQQRTPMGEGNISTMLSNIDKDRILEGVEPLLVNRLKYVRRTARGREITIKGREYLVNMRQRRG